jgi:hypothetical protein
MQISKLSSVICAVAVGASLVSVRAQDNPEQAAARAALLEKMNESEKTPAQPPAVVVTPAGASIETPAAPAVQMPPPTQPEPPVTPLPSGDNPAQAAARAALMEKLNGPSSTTIQTPTSAMTPAPSGDNPAQAAARTALMEKMNVPDAANSQPPLTIVTTPSNATPPTSPSPKPVTVPDNATQEKMDAARKAAQADATAQAEARAQAQQAAKAQKPATKTDVLGLPAIPAPALPISAAKQEQLEALLAKYKADQITPEEYQTQRAAILAQP